MSSFTLQEYRIQREYRQNKRQQFLKRFEALKQKGGKAPLVGSLENKPKMSMNPTENVAVASYSQAMALQHQFQQSRKSSQPQQQNLSNASETAAQELLAENQVLKKQLQQIELEERAELTNFKSEIGAVKEKYMEQIKAISANAQKNKQETAQKIQKLEQQMKNALIKNKEIQAVNAEIQKQLDNSTQTTESYANEIRAEYSKKLEEFETIFNSSNQKIEEMERDFNEDEFVENALKNEDLLKNIQENAEKSKEAVGILSDYQQLLAGKTEILAEVLSNTEMKENELKKMAELEGKMKIIFEKMNQEKRVYVEENQKMTKELMEIKDLIMGFMAQAQGEDLEDTEASEGV